MRIKPQFSIKHTAFLALFFVGLGYLSFQARFVILGPQLEITYPRNGENVASSIISVEGKAENVARLELNGRQIYTDEDGLWKEELVLNPGTSIITVTTKDRFGREAEQSVRITTN